MFPTPASVVRAVVAPTNLPLIHQPRILEKMIVDGELTRSKRIWILQVLDSTGCCSLPPRSPCQDQGPHFPSCCECGWYRYIAELFSRNCLNRRELPCPMLGPLPHGCPHLLHVGEQGWWYKSQFGSSLKSQTRFKAPCGMCWGSHTAFFNFSLYSALLLLFPADANPKGTLK